MVDQLPRRSVDAAGCCATGPVAGLAGTDHWTFPPGIGLACAPDDDGPVRRPAGLHGLRCNLRVDRGSRAVRAGAPVHRGQRSAPALGVVVYFGYFTVLTNILAATAFTAPLVGPESRLGRLFSRSDVITTITAAIVVVSVDYFLLLRSVWDPSGVQLAVDVSLHYVAPALCVVYWWLAVSRARLGWGDVGKSLVYPLGYIVYLIARGAVTGHYPYYFVDASKLGHGRALANMAAITGGFLIVAVALVGVTRLSARAPVES
jgi:hypothetical protein